MSGAPCPGGQSPSRTPAAGTATVLLAMFLDPAVRSFHADREKDAANAVAGFCFLEGTRPDDARIHGVLRTASESSREPRRNRTRRTRRMSTSVVPEFSSATADVGVDAVR
ncbi:hypothetical protein ACFWMV_20635 [Streptomyces mutabilis]|uniref:MmyB family transcriptional regulator n=1 Tax=Streptomyces mutabilis TaxID=67332 RepID=UPI003661B8C6